MLIFADFGGSSGLSVFLQNKPLYASFNKFLSLSLHPKPQNNEKSNCCICFYHFSFVMRSIYNTIPGCKRRVQEMQKPQVAPELLWHTFQNLDFPYHPVVSLDLRTLKKGISK